jgi:predicted nucleic acid-binding protein
MAAFDFDAARRWARAAPRHTLKRWPDAALPFIDPERIAGQALLLDTSVYIDQLQGRAPELVTRLIAARQVNHSTVAIQELMHAVGALEPKDRRTEKVIAAIRTVIQAMPPHRIFTPDAEVLGRAALLSGILSSLQGYAADAKLRALQDCTLFLQAQKLGFTVLTANIADYDCMLQVVPAGRVLFYRAATATSHGS